MILKCLIYKENMILHKALFIKGKGDKMIPNEVVDVIQSELVVRASVELEDAIVVELEKEDPDKEVAKAMLE
jgi:hypothetical protein